MSDQERTTSRPDMERSPKGRIVRKVDTAERDAEACRMRSIGHSFDHIAKTLGFARRSSAFDAVQRGLVAIVQEAAEDVRTFELERLDMLWRKASAILDRDHYAHSHGKLVLMATATDGEPMPLLDDMPKLGAIDRMLRIMERRAKLLGLDAPRQVEIITLDALQVEIREIEAKMAAREAAERHVEQERVDA